jgi:NAD(P)-dependent dehydrogenase (short-subunit alcohol dehydrogenase family)
MRIEGAVAIVAGGASGLGAATARALADSGARVVVADLAGAEVRTDVTDPDSVAAAVRAAVALGPLRIVVNCAGIAPPRRILGKDGPMPLEEFARVVQVNLVGTFNVCRLAAAAMAASDPDDSGERGVIVNTASVAAFEGQIGQCAYAASKAGVAGLTLPMARDLSRHGIRVVTIAPGLFDTPMMAGLPQDARESLAAAVPFPARLGDPAEYASLVLHIVGNRYLNGEVIRLDAALRMGPR